MDDKKRDESPLVSIIVPHLNGKHHLPDCLGSLRRQTFQDFEVILVDNGSTDGSQEFLREKFPEVILIELESNQGFTGACNVGYEASKGGIVILLNNDTESDPNWLQIIVDGFERLPQAGSIASKMLLFNERNVFHTAGDYYRLDGIPGNRGVWLQDQGQFDREEVVFSACGGAAAYRRRMLEEIGFLDDDYFFSCEDVDIAWRINLMGWQVVYLPTAVVYHKLKASASTGAISSYYDGRNFLYLIWKNYPSTLLLENWRAIARAQLQISLSALRSWRGAAARARLRGQFAGLFGLLKMWPKRRRIQRLRVINDETLLTRLTPVDETIEQR
ncbi:MAG: glycosyltransferase family 2 protein [Candidatus Promineifilaceae bacterium]|nr:glycosyltransferase family 2 protein [Candidatus Promineifilaceae bacterium]